MVAPSKESFTTTDSIAAAHGLLVHGARPTIARAFGALVDLQPMLWTRSGLLCAPWLDPDTALRALRHCPLPTSRAIPPPTVPDTPARLVSGWYRRTDLHAPAPPGVRELVQVPGSGFGPHDHPTTAMCLATLDRLPPGPVIDVGCGSGLLCQAWVAMGRPVALALDADPAAVAQTRASLLAAGHRSGWHLEVGHIEELDPGRMNGATVLANLPPIAHAALMQRLTRPPRALVLSGISRADAAPLIDHYRALGLRIARAMRSGRYVCVVLVGS